jgi:hypothetical protein
MADDKIYTTWKIPARYAGAFEAAEEAGMNHAHLTALAALLGSAVDDDGENDIASLAAAPAPAAPVARPIPAPAPKKVAGPTWDAVIGQLNRDS